MKVLFSIFITLLVFSCEEQVDVRSQLKSGDIIFRGSSSEALSQAIDKVTQTQKGTNFSHMGVIVVDDDEVWAIHASPEKGVAKEPLDSFLSKDSKSAIYRIDGITPKQIQIALENGNSLLGEPYNFTYIIADTGYYCSEFVYTIFEEAKVFDLEPMTFKNPESDDFPKTWVEYYQQLGIDIPEGLPGCNPNGMAANDKLKRIGNIE